MDENEQERFPEGSEHDPLMPPGGDAVPTDAGAYIGHEPELARETIPGGVQRGDTRVAAVATQIAGAGAQAHTPPGASEQPGGHRQGDRADDESTREAGQDR